ncbi:MAG: hypothetical protein AB7F41_07005 [Methylocystis sp.]|uniref:hypothetical protein n=1 Tax=Methylocystis sp. TaxID=1911079 RepID=UPI003D0DC2F4
MSFCTLKRAFVGVALAAASFFPATGAEAHGGVKLEQDECVLRIGPNTMHFIGYQRTGEEQEFCEDIAQTGPTVIALTAVSPDLRDMAIGIRVVKDVGEEKEKADIDAATVAYYPPKVYRNGTMTFEHDFKEAGRYVGIVTVSDDLGNQWVSRFPFTVGVFTFMGYIEYILYGVGFTALCAGLWFYLGRSGRRAPVAAARSV